MAGEGPVCTIIPAHSTGNILYPIGCPVANIKQYISTPSPAMRRKSGKKCKNLWSRPFCHKEYLSHWAAWHGMAYPCHAVVSFLLDNDTKYGLSNKYHMSNANGLFPSHSIHNCNLTHAHDVPLHRAYSNLISLNWLFFLIKWRTNTFGVAVENPPHIIHSFKERKVLFE